MSQKKQFKGNKEKRKHITMEVKREIIEKREQGVSVADLARLYNRNTSTICTILKKKDKIKEINFSKGVSRFSVQRPHLLDDVERLLLIWINEKQLQGDSISESFICEKAKLIYSDLVKNNPGASTNRQEETFKASHGWFDKFKRRTGIHSVVRYNEAASSHRKAAEKFVGVFKNSGDGYMPQQVFNCDEPSFFWKKMPKRTFITAEEKVMPSHNVANHGFEGCESVPLVDYIVSLGKTMGLDVDNKDIEELVKEHRQELATEELMNLHSISQQEIAEEISLGEEIVTVSAEQQPSTAIREMLAAWENVSSYVEKFHPNKAVAMCSTNLFNQTAVSHFRQILKRRQKEMSLDSIPVKNDSNKNAESDNAFKRFKASEAVKTVTIASSEEDSPLVKNPPPSPQ